MFKEIPHFAIALADQRDDTHGGGTAARHGAQQRALSDARAAEDADPLSLAAGQQTVDGANAGGQRLPDRLALQRARRGCVEIVRLGARDRAASIQRTSKAVDHAAEQLRSHLHPGVFSAGHDGIAQVQTIGLFERHRKNTAVAETDYLRADAPSGAGRNFAEISHRRLRPARFHQQTDQLGHIARPAAGLQARQFFVIRLQVHECVRTRSANPRSISASCVSTEASRIPRLDSRVAPPGATLASAITSTRCGRPI